MYKCTLLLLSTVGCKVLEANTILAMFLFMRVEKFASKKAFITAENCSTQSLCINPLKLRNIDMISFFADRIMTCARLEVHGTVGQLQDGTDSVTAIT